ncbi:MAG: LCP family protein [Clostridia bacterium]
MKKNEKEIKNNKIIKEVDKYTNTKINKKSGVSVIKIIISVIIILIIMVFIGGGYILWSKWSLMKHKELNETDLAVNANIEKLVSDDIEKSEIKGVRSVALFGTDSRDSSDMNAGRTDSIMVVSINPSNKSIKLISIPRDTYVDIPGHGKDKINHAYAYGEEQLALKTINKNFGLNIVDYATIDFSGLINIINDIGGVEVEISKEEMIYINGRNYEEYKLSGNKPEKITNYGKVLLTGEQALAHSRNRTVGNDFKRATRQRDVLQALINKLSNEGITKILSISDEFFTQIRTNLSIVDYMQCLTSVMFNKDTYMKNIVSVQIPSNDYSEGKMIRGVYYYATDINKAKKEFIKYIYEK